MDLLGGYTTSSSDENDSDQDENENKLSSTVAPRGSLSLRVDDGVTNKPKDIALDDKRPMSKTTTASASSVRNSKAKKRGKKLLKLSAVLPEHIWSQLSGATPIASSAASSSGEADDDSDDGNYYATHEKGKQHAQVLGAVSNVLPTKGTAAAKDSGLLGLLQALPKSKSATYSNSRSTILTDDDPTEIQPPRVSDKSQNEEQTSSTTTSSQLHDSLGAAFVTSTVKTTVRKRTEPSASQVRDIHNPYPATDKVSTPNALNDTTNEAIGIAGSATSAQPSTTSFTISRQPLPRPTASRTVTLPPRPVAATHTTAYAPPPSWNEYNSTVDSQTQNVIAAVNANGGAKRGKNQSRKRQMEEMLRAGKLGEIQEDHRLEATSNVYIPPDAGSGGGVNPSMYNGHGVRVVPTVRYNVGTGGTSASTDITGRQKNKHQLNSLLASAASLEAHRLQNPHFGAGTGGGTAGGSGSHRATAKRKYGW